MYTNPETGEQMDKDGWSERLRLKVPSFSRRLVLHGPNSPLTYRMGGKRGPKVTLFRENPETGELMDVEQIAEWTGQSTRAIRARIARGTDVFHRGELPYARKFRRVKKYPYPLRYIGFSTEQIAKAEEVSISTVQKWSRTGRWPPRLLPLVPPAASAVT